MSAFLRELDPLRRGLNVALGLIAFLFVAAGFRLFVPWPEEYGLRTKFEYFKEHRDEFDALFIGSSRVFRAIDPVIVDAALERRGIPMRSFNLGVGGMRTYEQDFLLHEVLKLEPANLEYVFFEGGDWDPRFGNSFNVFSSRSVFWHSLPQVAKVLSAIWEDSGALRERLELATTHVRLGLSKLTSYSQGRGVLQRMRNELVDVRNRSLSSEQMRQGRGFESADLHVERRGEEPPETIWSNPAVYYDRVASIPGQNERHDGVERVPLWAVRAQLREAERRGVTLVYLTVPGDEGTPVRPLLHAMGEIPELFDFNRPELYPQFFTVDSRFDPRHLNRKGALELSELIAELVALRFREEIAPRAIQ